MVKRKLENIEDAEIIASKEAKYDDSLVIKKVNKLQTQFYIFLVLFCVIILIICGTLVYKEYNRAEEITNLQSELKTLASEFTFKFIDSELDDRELEVQKKTIILIDQAVKNLEEIFVNKLNLVADISDNRKVIKLFEDELLKLKLQFDKKISEVNKINNEKNETFLSEGREFAQVQTMFDSLDLRVQQRLEILGKSLAQIEKEFSISKNKLLDIEFSIMEKPNKSLSVNLETFMELEKSFVEIAYSALKIEAQRNIRGNLWSKFISTLRSIFVFRSTEPKDGSSLDAILSRAEHMLSVRNFEECLNELHTLDTVSLELFSEWMEKIILLSNTTK